MLKKSKQIHTENVAQIEYLERYIKGDQPILRRQKKVREDICNNIVENHASNIISFKTGYVFGEPIQYVKHNDSAGDDISELNQLMNYLDKSFKDMQLAEWLYSFGIGYRFVKLEDDPLTPFSIINIHPKNAFTVYYDGFNEDEQVCTVIAMKKFNEEKKLVDFFQVYTDTEIIECTEKEVISRVINPLGTKQLIEYRLNSSMQGCVEKVIDGLNALNTITSGEVDDIEQFVQSILVFINNKVDKKTFLELIEYGAVNITDVTDKKKADVKLLNQKLVHTETKVFYTRILNNICNIVGMPKSSDKASGGDTGQAIMNRDGWRTTELKAKEDELNFTNGEKQLLKVVKKIFDMHNIFKDLKIFEISIKFSRNRNDNLLTKVQALTELKHVGVEPNIAFSLVELFSDPIQAVIQSKAFFGENFFKVKTNANYNAYDNEQIAYAIGQKQVITDETKEIEENG